MTSLSYQDIELEFYITTDIHFKTQNGKRKMIINTKTPFIAYQNWSIKTININNTLNRVVFPVTCNQLSGAANSYSDYKPSVVLTTKDKKHYLFSITHFKIVPNNNSTENLVMILEDNMDFGGIPEDGKYSNARINLSTMPYHLLNFNDSLSIFPKSENTSIQPKHYLEDNSYSFLMEAHTNSVVTENGISKIIISKNTPLYAYEQWSSIHNLNNNNRTVKKIDWTEALKNKDAYKNETGDTFTPSVFIEIENENFIGVITDVKPVDQSKHHHELSNIEDALDIEITIDTSIMRKKDSSGNESLPSLPNITTKTNIYMNIDDTINLKKLFSDGVGDVKIFRDVADVDHLRILNYVPAGYQLSIQDNQILALKSDFTNYGLITIYSTKAEDANLDLNFKTAIHLYNYTLINEGTITFLGDSTIDTDNLNSFITGRRLVNKASGTISFMPNNSTDDILVTASKDNNKFTFLDCNVVNAGVISFNKINNDSGITVTGITLMEQQLGDSDADTREGIPTPSKGMTRFYGLSSMMHLTNTTEQENITIGVKECLSNTGAFIFGEISNGNLASLRLNGAIPNVTQTTIGIKYMGAVDNKVKNNAISFKLTNPNYNKYGIMDSDINNEETPETSKISGCAENSLIFINRIINSTVASNTKALTGACGIYNVIQTHTSAVIQINEIINYAYGGETSCLGIFNLLVNNGAVCINDVVMNLGLNSVVLTDSKCYGIYNVVQNGYTENNRSFLPPFPPVHYNNKGTPQPYQLNGNQITHISRENFMLDNVDNTRYNVITRKYKQGHISIHSVHSLSIKNQLAIGIGQYGGFSFDDTIMNDDGKNMPTDITLYMQKYVHKYNALSIVWSYPIDANTVWLQNQKSPFLEESFPKDPNYGYLNSTQLVSEMRKNGWYWTFNNPVQMYYKYEENTDTLTDSIFFPINWGIVSIDYVVAGLLDENGEKSENEIIGSAYGIEKCISSIGAIQINMIESNIKQHYLNITTKEVTLENTNDNPELSRLFLNDESAPYVQMPVEYLQNQEVTEVNFNSINDLPVMITIESADIANPEDRIDGIWTTGTNTQLNYCFPYQISNKSQHNDVGFNHISHNDLVSEFTLPPEQENDFELPDSNPASNLLEALSSPGAAIGVYRTIDYGSDAPGLTFLKTFTQPISSQLTPLPWNGLDTVLSPQIGKHPWWYMDAAFEMDPPTPFEIDNTGSNSKRVQKVLNTLDYDHSFIQLNYGLNHNIDTIDCSLDIDSKLTPVTSSLYDKNRGFHWQVLREPVTTNPPFRGCDYLHYPFLSTNFNGGKNYVGLQQYLPPGFGNNYQDQDNIWKGWNVKDSQLLKNSTTGNCYTEQFMITSIETNGDLQDLIDKPLSMGMITKWIDEISIEPHFEDPELNSSLFIYNSSWLNSKLKNNYYKNIYESDSNYVLPNPDNIFNGLTPFPLLSGQNTLSQFSNLSYTSRTFQDKIVVPEKILWNASSYRFTKVIKSGTSFGRLPGTQTESGWMPDSNYQTFEDYGDWNGETVEYDWLMPDDELKAETHDEMLEVIFGEIGGVSQTPKIGQGMPCFFNLLKSLWPYSSAVRELTNFYYGDVNYLPSDSGRTGPINSTFFTDERVNDDHIRNLADLLSYNYSPTRPIGFNPQLIQGGMFKVEPQHPSYNNIVRENGGARSFLNISKGKEFIESHIDRTLYKTDPIISNHVMTHESDFFNKYKTDNRYFGFIYENRNPMVKAKYTMTNMLLGQYSRYRDVLNMVNNLIYINAQDEDDYYNKYTEYKFKQAQKSKEEQERKEQATSSATTNLILMLVMSILPGLPHLLMG